MNRNSVKKALVVLGFGLTILVDLFYTWGGWVFESSSLVGFQSLLFMWSVPHQLASAFVFLLLVLFSSRLRQLRDKVALPLAVILILVGHTLILPSITHVDPELMISLAALCIGSGVSILLAFWITLFAQYSADESHVLILASLIVYAILFLGSNRLSQLVLSFAPPMLIIVAAAAAFIANRIAVSEQCIVPAEPATEVSGTRLPVWQSIVMLRSPLFCAASIVFAVPLTRISALVDSVNIVWMNIVTSLVIIGIVALLLLLRMIPWRRSDFFRTFDIPHLFKFSLPLVATALVLYTVVGSALALPVSVTVFVLFYLVWLLMIPTCVSTAQKLDTSPLLCYGVVSCIVNLIFAGATWLGAFLLAGELYFGAATLSVCMLLVLYVLMMTLSLQKREAAAATAVVVAAANQTSESSQMQSVKAGDAEEEAEAEAEAASAPQAFDTGMQQTERVCRELALKHLLTPREYDTLLLMAHGRDAPYIAKQLFISKNTVRTHIKSLYIKMNVHSRQELLDLLQERSSDIQKTASSN